MAAQAARTRVERAARAASRPGDTTHQSHRTVRRHGGPGQVLIRAIRGEEKQEARQPPATALRTGRSELRKELPVRYCADALRSCAAPARQPPAPRLRTGRTQPRKELPVRYCAAALRICVAPAR